MQQIKLAGGDVPLIAELLLLLEIRRTVDVLRRCDPGGVFLFLAADQDVGLILETGQAILTFEIQVVVTRVAVGGVLEPSQ